MLSFYKFNGKANKTKKKKETKEIYFKKPGQEKENKKLKKKTDKNKYSLDNRYRKLIENFK